MADYSFRLAKFQEQSSVIEFLNNHWGDKHPLVNNDRLREHYFCDGDSFNFALCTLEDTIVAAAGFIYSSKAKDAAFVSIWCADKSHSGAGLELMDAMKGLIGVHVLCCNNIRPNTMPFYEFLGYKTGCFTHAYMLADRLNYKVAKIKKCNIIAPKSTNSLLTRILRVDDGTLNQLTSNLAIKKDGNYLRHRYLEYPFANYELYVCSSAGGEIQGIVILRVVGTEGTTAIKFVDFIGNPKDIVHCGQPLRELLEERGAEYIEFYCAGVSENILTDAGFSVRTQDDENIIPTYIEPIDCRNVDFYYFTSDDNQFTMYRADGDGDRPNIIL